MPATKQGGAPLPVYLTNPGDIVVSVADGLEVTTTPATGTTQTVEQKTYTSVKAGEIQGAAAATQLPSISCKLVKFKARNDNAGNVYLGGAGVTLPDGTTDVTTGIELDAGEETGWIPVDNLNRFYRICNNAGDDLTYLALE